MATGIKNIQARRYAEKYVTDKGDIKAYVYRYFSKTAKNGRKEVELLSSGDTRGIVGHFLPYTWFAEIASEASQLKARDIRDHAIAKLFDLKQLGYKWVSSVLSDFRSVKVGDDNIKETRNEN